MKVKGVKSEKVEGTKEHELLLETQEIFNNNKERIENYIDNELKNSITLGETNTPVDNGNRCLRQHGWVMISALDIYNDLFKDEIERDLEVNNTDLLCIITEILKLIKLMIGDTKEVLVYNDIIYIRVEKRSIGTIIQKTLIKLGIINILSSSGIESDLFVFGVEAFILGAILTISSLIVEMINRI